MAKKKIVKKKVVKKAPAKAASKKTTKKVAKKTTKKTPTAKRVKSHARAERDAQTSDKLTGLAQNIVRIVQEFDPQLCIVGLASGKLLAAAREREMPVLQEAFADRRYAPDGTLLPRSDPRALIYDAQEALEQCLQIITRQCVNTVDGSLYPLHADTLCLHGDSPAALVFAQHLHAGLQAEGIEIRPAHRKKLV